MDASIPNRWPQNDFTLTLIMFVISCHLLVSPIFPNSEFWTTNLLKWMVKTLGWLPGVCKDIRNRRDNRMMTSMIFFFFIEMVKDVCILCIYSMCAVCDFMLKPKLNRQIQNAGTYQWKIMFFWWNIYRLLPRDKPNIKREHFQYIRWKSITHQSPFFFLCFSIFCFS